ncbi:hypothetical protein D3C71_1604140 [compost metagenome]
MAMVYQGMKHVVHRRIEGGKRTSRNARLAVNADAKLHLVFRQHERGLAGGRYGTGPQCDADRMPVIVDAVAQRHQAIQIVAARRCRTEQFFHQHGIGHPATSGGEQAVFHRHVIVHQHRRHLDAAVMQQLGGGFKVQHVAGIVFY